MKIAVFCSSSEQVPEIYRQAATHLGSLIAQHGHSLVFGGNHCGLMGCVADGAQAANGEIIGINLKKWENSGLNNPGNTRTLYVENLSERKKLLIELSDVFVALPGGIGTLDEASEVMAEHQLGFLQQPVVFVNVNGFFDGLKTQFERFAAENFFTENSKGAFRFVTSPDEVFE